MRILFTGGGTGGHIYPAMALARYIKNVSPGANILFVGAKGGMEEKIIPASGFCLKTLPVRGLPRRLNLPLFHALLMAGKSSVLAGKIIDGFRPDFVVGTGGYAAAPIILAALLKRKKVIIHEQNVIPGITNRFVAPYVYKVCLSFEASTEYFLKRSNLCITGNPRASEVGLVGKKTARKILNMDHDLPFLLAVGGSRGAARLNQSMADFLSISSGNKNIQVLYITGERYYDDVIAKLKDAKVFDSFNGRLQVRPYQQEMLLALAAADLVITRAGATTLAEITALGTPALIIPSPNVVHNHQLINARELSRQGAAITIEEGILNGKILLEEVNSLLQNPAKLKQMQEKCKKMGYPKAAESIYSLMLS